MEVGRKVIFYYCCHYY